MYNYQVYISMYIYTHCVCSLLLAPPITPIYSRSQFPESTFIPSRMNQVPIIVSRIPQLFANVYIVPSECNAKFFIYTSANPKICFSLHY